MRTICETVLDDARAGAHSVPGTADVMALLRRLAVRLEAPEKTTLTVSGPDTLVAGVPAALLERIVAPLVDNALRYACNRVAIRVSTGLGGIRVAVVDDGPGVPAAFTADLFQPGRRADPEDGHGGAGLGLPLARRLARSAGGDVTHDGGHHPGARFVVSLPTG